MLNNYLTKQLINILKVNYEARDNMMLCVKLIHNKEMDFLCIEKENYYDALFNGKLSKINTIDVLWRRIQLKYPELRGDEWEVRQMMAGLYDWLESDPAQLSLFNQELN